MARSITLYVSYDSGTRTGVSCWWRFFTSLFDVYVVLSTMSSPWTTYFSEYLFPIRPLFVTYVLVHYSNLSTTYVLVWASTIRLKTYPLFPRRWWVESSRHTSPTCHTDLTTQSVSNFPRPSYDSWRTCSTWNSSPYLPESLQSVVES